jgi:hypothetical protein
MTRNDGITKAVTSCVDILNAAGFTREEVVIFLSQLLSRIGASIHWQFEGPEAPMPEKMTPEVARKLYLDHPTTGTTILKVAFDLMDVLVHKQ